jgi:septal ring factor EnvC (AmiA/AmiB activator)
MPFEVEDYLELIRLLQERPEWRAELRRLLLTEELLGLPGLVRELVEAQRRTEERVGGVEERVGRIEEYIAALADAQRRTEERVGRLEERVGRVEERVGRVEEQIAALAEAQRRTEERVGRVEEQIAALAEAQRRTEERVGRVEEQIAALAEAQRRTEERVGRVEEQIAALAEAQRRTEEQMAQLVEAQRRTEEQIRVLAKSQELFAQRQEWLVSTVEDLKNTVGELKGRVLERTYHEKASAYFGPLLRQLRIVDPYTLEETLRAYLSPEEFSDLLRLDLLLCGQPRSRPEVTELWIAVEISAVVDQGDVERARRRAAHLRRAGYRAIPMVAGERLTLSAEDEVRRHRVAVLQDGRALLWEEALQAWTEDLKA